MKCLILSDQKNIFYTELKDNKSKLECDFKSQVILDLKVLARATERYMLRNISYFSKIWDWATRSLASNFM